MESKKLKGEQQSSSSLGKTKFKVVFLGVLALLALVVVLQNTEAVETKVLFFTLTVPRAILLFGTFIVGFILGIITANRIQSK